jgi:hypothetical protein
VGKILKLGNLKKEGIFYMLTTENKNIVKI